MSDSQSVPPSSAASDAVAGSAASASAAAHGAEETARRLANLQAMLNRLQVPKLGAQPTTLPGAAPARRASAVGVVSDNTQHSSSTSSLRPLATDPQPIASHTARRASLARKRSSLAPSASALEQHRAPPLPTGPAASTAARRRSLAAPLQGPKRSTSTGSTTAAPSLSSELNGAGRPLVRRAARGKTCLQGVSAFVDVRTADGDDSGMIFVDMLKDLGARVRPKASLVLTHCL